ncbi:MAG: peptidoglycan D,D-transpeptidase FtsI family protein [Acidimicrobiales bacterium]
MNGRPGGGRRRRLPGAVPREAGGRYQAGVTRRSGPLRAGHRPARRSRARYLVSMAAMTACLCGILTRLLFVQGIGSARYREVARSEYVHEVSYLGERGAILDRNGDELAMSVPMKTIYADPYQVTNPRAEAALLARALALPELTLQDELSEASGFVYLAHTVPDTTAARVEKLIDDNVVPGIYTMEEPKRFYPAGPLASPLLGSVGTDGQGLGGLEYKYNGLLEGRPGKLVADMDPAGYQIPGGLREYRAPVRGDDVVLSIDEPLQYDAEEALARAIVAAQAQSGMALIINSRTGELLAVADLTMRTRSEPVTEQEPPALPISFVPSSAAAGSAANAASGKALAAAQPVESPSASAFTTVYEPGSVEKLVTISGALASGAIMPSQVFQVPNSIDVAGTAIFDAWAHPTLDWSAPNILAHSSDIGTVEIAQRMGLPTLLRYIRAFGMGKRTDIDFPGGSAGLVPGPSQWSGTTIATVPIGQGVAVTAIQMLDAYNTIANGGMFVAPRLVDGYVDAEGHEHLFPVPKPHRVVSALVAREMTSMLEGVVRVGTGTAANLEPYTVAGKTGTALYPRPGGGYYNSYFISSFAGFAPAEDPAVTAMAVVVGTHQYGAQASAPVFAMIMRDALQELGVPPHKPEPPVPGLPQASAYGAEGEAAGPALPGLSGVPNVKVNTTASATTLGATTTALGSGSTLTGGTASSATTAATSATTATTVVAPTTTSAGPAFASTTTVPAATPTTAPTSAPTAALTTAPITAPAGPGR